jgi:hypothetical protein
MFRVKQLEIYTGDVINFKKKNASEWRTNRISAISDSAFYFSDGSRLRFPDVKKFRVRAPHSFAGTFQKFFLGLGVMFFPLNTVNQAIIGDRPLFSEKAALVSAGLLVCSFVCRELTIKRIRIDKRTEFKVTEKGLWDFSK